MLREFCHFDLAWARIHVAQVDERIAPPGDPRRNLTRLEQILVTAGPLPSANLHAMPVNHGDVEQAALDYQRQLEALAGRPVVLDLVQLGLGTDGHTASLVPGDPVLAVTCQDVAVSGEYQGLQRMTLTFPAIDRARQRLWLVTGGNKAVRLRQLLAVEPATDVPATHVNRSQSVVIADEAAVAAARPGLSRNSPPLA
jgi:6-phosphogluconolactonase